MAGTVLVPGTQTGWNLETWERTFEVATYQKMVFIPVIDEAMRPYNLGHIRRATRVSGATVSSTSDGTGLTYVNPVGTVVTMTPVASTVPIAWSEPFDSRTETNVDSQASTASEGALAETTETAALLNIVSGTQIMSQASVDATMLRQGMGRLAMNTNGTFAAGEGQTIYGIFSFTQQAALMAIPEVNSAEKRGDSENPYIRGIWTRGLGFVLLMSTVIAQDANGWHNGLFVPSAFAIAWNVRTLVKRQDIELQNRLIGFNDVATALKNDLRLIQLITTATSL
jgi:hypothetical protein